MIRRLRWKITGVTLLVSALVLTAVFACVYLFSRNNIAQSYEYQLRQAVVSGTSEARVPCFVAEVLPSGTVRVSGSNYYDLQDEDTLLPLVTAALSADADSGVLPAQHMRYFRLEGALTVRIAFMDSTFEQATLRSLVRVCLLIGAAALLVLFGLSWLLSGFVTRPVARTWQNQQQFLSDASHELKTPLTVILSSADLLKTSAQPGQRQYVVEDAQGNTLFRIPLRGCMIDTRFRGGRLRFREMATGREGYVDTNGMVTFTAGAAARTKAVVPEDELTRQNMDMENRSVESAGHSDSKSHHESKGHAVKLTQTDIRKIAQSSPFYKEAAKILKGKLTETDASRRRQILNYCEHLRTAYTTKDIDFLRQVFSDEALIIVGNVVKESATTAGIGSDSRVTYALHTKRDYLSRLAKVFAVNKTVDVKFSDFRIMRHPTKDGIYGVSLRQRYSSDRYSDDGWLFLLWDFRNPSMPLIHVRTWQPSATVSSSEGVIDISDFNLE